MTQDSIQIDVPRSVMVRAVLAGTKTQTRRLVQALRSVHEAEEGIGETDRPHFVALRVLLRELGEEQ